MATVIAINNAGSTYHLHSSAGTPTPFTVLGSFTQSATPFKVDTEKFRWAPFDGDDCYNTTPMVRDIPLIAYSASADALALMLTNLRQIVNVAHYEKPPYLYIQPNGSTAASYWQVWGGDVIEEPWVNNPFEAAGEFRITLRLLTSPFGGRLATPETLISAVSMGNVGTGSPTNYQSFSPPGAAVGDLANDGQPMNYLITPTNSASDPIRRIILASCGSRTYYGLSSGNTWSTSATDWASAGSITISSSQALTAFINKRRFKIRILGVISTYTGTPEYRFMLLNGATTASRTYSAAIPLVGADGLNQRFIDSGPMTYYLPPFKNLNDTTLAIYLQIRSADGAATTGTLASVEFLTYYDYCDVRLNDTNLATGAGTLYDVGVNSFAEYSNVPCLPFPEPIAVAMNTASSNKITDWGVVRGRVPRYYAGSGLYVRLLDATGSLVYTTTSRTFTVTATHAPLYRTVRGAG